MSLPAFSLHLPETVEQAIAISQAQKGENAFLAGGTDLLINQAERLNYKRHLISLSKISALKKLTRSNGSGLVIGAGVSIAELQRQRHLLPPVLGQTAALIASPALRESATIGGNLLLGGRCVYFNQTELYRCSHGACMKAEGESCIAVPQNQRCYAPFSGDLAACLLVLDASFVLVGPAGPRVVPAGEFYCADGISANVLSESELLLEIHLPELAFDLSCSYRKLRPRSSVDFPEAGVALGVRRQGSETKELRVGITALGPAPGLAVLKKEEFAGLKPGEIADLCWKNLSPHVLAVRNTSFSPGYRREMARLFIEQLLEGELL